MTSQLSRDLVDRLVCAKYIFRRSCELLDSRNPFSAGLAVSGFQDSTELVLRTIVEHLHLSLKETAAFSQIIDTIEVETKTKLPYRTTLNQLNKARTSFKHFGLEPKDQDARKFHRDLEVFFPAIFRQFFAVDFESISLIDLIDHRRTENFLHEAERAIEQDDFQLSVRASAVAFYFYRLRTKRSVRKRFNLNPFNRKVSQELKSALDDLKKLFEDQQEEIDILMDGINPVEFQRFKRLAPQVRFSMAHTFSTHYPIGRREAPDREDALFCLRFALDAILLMKSLHVPPSSRKLLEANLKIVKKAPAVVWPDTDRVEIIRDVEEGELFSGSLHRSGKHVMISLDGEPAYIPLEAVEEIIKGSLAQQDGQAIS